MYFIAVDVEGEGLVEDGVGPLALLDEGLEDLVTNF